MNGFGFGGCPRPSRYRVEAAAPPPPAPAGISPFAPVIGSITPLGSGNVTITWYQSETLADGETAVDTGQLVPKIYYSTVDGAGTGGTSVTASTGSTSHTFNCGTGTPLYFTMTNTLDSLESEPSAQSFEDIT